MKKAKAILAKDEAKRQEKEVQNVTEEFVSKVDCAMDAKEKEVLSL
eukprot:CAMPEP_0119333584 /NCGR_PEP_ID=MMETSP1333-20130426/85473_1 /TAXON_ID=418940 /ORGANISM="Scyphosphaera apsteinii, Strain RCC1455" /LENGTH=45 /DNA_ID= /DNA_START= /DNA_END= /DNA_ORIENTATION=